MNILKDNSLITLKMKSIFFISFLFLVFSCNDKNITVVNNGKTNYAIAISSNASKSIKHTAFELQHYINEITGTTLEIGTLGTSPHQLVLKTDGSLAQGEIAMKWEKDDFVISADTDRNLNYAVYDFLERYLGCKWLTPKVEDVPKKDILKLPKGISYNYTPDIKVRTVHSRLFYEDSTFADKRKVTHEAFPFYVSEAKVHTFHRFIPEETFYHDHPEYFALRDNKRLPTQLCLTNPEVLQLVKDSVRALFEKYPNASVISVSQNDNQQYCQCPVCKKSDAEHGGPSGTMMAFVNEVAKAFPDKTISTLAYQYTRKPGNVTPRLNVLVTLCSIECDRSASIQEKCTDFAQDLKGWGKLTNNIRIWDYTTQFTNFLAPFPNLHTLKPNLEFFKNNGVAWVFEQHSNNPNDLFELRSYVMARLLWNPARDTDSLITEFTQAYYREAGTYIKQYVDALENNVMQDPNASLYLYGDPSQAFQSFLSPEHLKEYMSFFDEAETAVAHKPEVLERVKTARLGLDYAVLEICRKGISNDFRLIPKEGQNTSVNTLELLEHFKTTSEKENIMLMNEMGYAVTEYYEAYKNTIQRAAMPNKALGKLVTTLTKPKKYADEDPQTLTDGAFGGSSFFSNWLGYEGNDMEVVIDLGEVQDISHIETTFLQVTNHIVFFPKEVVFSISTNYKDFVPMAYLPNARPLQPNSKVNDTQLFKATFKTTKARYIKVKAINVKKAPFWHHAAGLPVWVFADEVIVN